MAKKEQMTMTPEQLAKVKYLYKLLTAPVALVTQELRNNDWDVDAAEKALRQIHGRGGHA